MIDPVVAIIALLIALNIAQAMYARVLEMRVEAAEWRARIG